MPAESVRFMIACAARTGSTMLVRLLRSHPGLVVHGEVWGDRMVGLDGPLARRCEADPALHDALEQQRFTDPDASLRRFLDAGDRQGAGFKLKFDELVRPQWAPIRDRVVADEGLRMVFLHRDDLLRRYVSHQVVLRQTGVTNVPVGEALPKIEPFTVQVEDVLADIRTTRERTQAFEAAFAGHPCLHLRYEALARAPQAACDQVFQFLGVPSVPVRVATEKIVRNPIESLLLNHAEVQAALREAGL